MTQVQGIPYRRHGPSAAVREFLDPLDPGDYFDCGRARLHGLDDALLEEARSRGRTIGDDAFLLVATDVGLIFCRPSISFVIIARWDEINLIRPRGSDPVVLPVAWPRHGELKFTLSKRLAGNIFRRWLQLRMHADRQARQAGPGSLPGSITFGSDLDPAPALSSPVDLDDVAPVEDDEIIDLADSVGLDDANWSDGPEPETDPGFGHHGPHRGDRHGPHEPVADGLDDLAVVDPPRPRPAETADDFPFSVPAAIRSSDGILVDEELQRVTVPKIGNAPPSWVGSAVSIAASLVVVSTVVLIVAVSISLWRGVAGDGSSSTSTDIAGATPTTIDHKRFRASSDPIRQLDSDSSDELLPSAAGGASQSVPPSSQQLLAVRPDAEVGLDPDRAIRCSSNYSGCVPDVVETADADVDCVGQGDGPYFAEPGVMVLGEDIYGLDSDGDRVACEADQIAAESLSADP